MVELMDVIEFVGIGMYIFIFCFDFWNRLSVIMVMK